MSAPASCRIIPTDNAGDCAIAALATFTGRPYSDIHEVVLRTLPGRKITRKGMWTSEMLRVAKALKLVLRKRVATLEVCEGATGLLILEGRKRNQDNHVVVLLQGVVLDSETQAAWDLPTYLKVGWWRVKWLLEA